MVKRNRHTYTYTHTHTNTHKHTQTHTHTSAANTCPTFLNKIHWVCTLSLLKLAAFSRVFATFTSLIQYFLVPPDI